MKLKAGLIAILSLILIAPFLSLPVYSTTQSLNQDQNVLVIAWDAVQRNHLYELMNDGSLPNLSSLSTLLNLTIVEQNRLPITVPGFAEMLTGVKADYMRVYSNELFNTVPDGLTIWEKARNMNPSIYAAGIVSNPNVFMTKYHKTTPFFRVSDRGIFYNAKSDLNTWIETSAQHSLTDVDSFGEDVLSLLTSTSTKQSLTFVLFEYTDYCGHEFGENSQEYNAAIIYLDVWLGRIVQRLNDLQIFDRTSIYVMNDHGFRENMTGHAAWVPDNYNLWLATNNLMFNTSIQYQHQITPAILRGIM